MSRAIKVLVDAEDGVDVRQLSGEEREILFDKISAEVPSIPDVVFLRFLEGFNDILRKELALHRPDMPEILLKQIVLMSCSVTNFHLNSTRINLPNTILPIVGSYTGGEIPALKRALKPIKNLPKRSDNGLRIRFDRSVLISTIEGDILSIAPGDDISVIGLRTGYRPTYGRDPTYKNIIPLLPTGCYRAEDVFDSTFASDTISTFPAELQWLKNNTPSTKILFEGDPLNQLVEVFSQVASTVFMPESFGYFAHTMIRVAISDPKSPLYKLLVPFISAPITSQPTVQPSAEPDPTLLLLNSLGTGKFFSEFKLSLIHAVYGRNLASVYNNIIIDGIDSSFVQNKLTVYRDNIKRAKFLAKLKIEKAQREILNSTYRSIVLSKLGKQRAKEIEDRAKNDPLTFQTDGILPFLKPTERKLVDLEYNKQQEYTKSVIGNNCPHVAIYRKLRRSIDINSMSLNLRELKKFYARSSAGSMIKCNNCGFNIICPHYDEYITYVTESDRAIKTKLSKYVETGENARGRDTFCKICGEVLSGIDALEGLSEDVPEYMDEELRNFIWSEVAISMKFFKFGPMLDVGKVISKVRDGIYSYIFNVEKQILRSKTTTADEIKARKRLYTAVYGYAYMVHLIMSNIRSDVISLQGFKITDPRKAIPELIKRGIELIMVSRVTTIREIPGISVDIIKNMMVTAYKEISSEGVVSVKEESTIDRQIDLDPVFNSAVNILLMNMIYAKKQLTPKIKADFISSIQKDILEKKKLDDSSIFSSIMRQLNWDVSEFMKLKIPVGVGFDGKSDPYNVYLRAMPGYIAASYNIIVKYVVDKLYLDEKYAGEMEKLEDSLRSVAEHERYLQRYKSLAFCRVFNTLKKPSQKFSNPNPSISRIYDEDGKEHKWSIFVYNIDNEHKEYTAGDIAKIVSGGKSFDAKPIDKKCSVCGALWSQTGELSVEKIEESLRAMALLDNFFRFYESRCPKGDLHVYAENGTACTKCGISVGTGANTSGAINIFRQHKSAYNRDKNEIDTLVISPPVISQPAPNKYTEYENFAPNFSVVATVADKLGVNQKLLLALGATEKIEYADILSGKYIPPEVEERNSPRIYTLDSYIRTLYIEWNQMRVFYRYQRQNSDIARLIESSNISRQDLSSVMQTLPDIDDNYLQRFEYIKWNLKPRDIVSFCIQVFCEKVLKILAVEGPGAKIARLYAEYIVKKILRNDELVSKPGYFSWSVVFGDKESKQDVGEADASEPAEIETDRNDDGNEFAMSLEAFDVEEDPDADPDDDPANQVRVDDKYGID